MPKPRPRRLPFAEESGEFHHRGIRLTLLRASTTMREEASLRQLPSDPHTYIPQWRDRAGFWLRAAALSVDTVVVLLLTAIAYYAVVAGYDDELGLMSGNAARWLLLAQLVPWLAYSFTEVLFSATPGKMLLGLRIGTQSAARASRWMLFDRWSTKNYPFIVLFLYAAVPHPCLAILGGFMRTVILVGCIPAMNDDRLAWHDEWSRTAVWKTRGMTERVGRGVGHREQPRIIHALGASESTAPTGSRRNRQKPDPHSSS